MTRLIILHDHVSDQIDKDLNNLRDTLPPEEQALFEAERDVHRQLIINHIGEFGTYPTIGGITKSVGAI